MIKKTESESYKIFKCPICNGEIVLYKSDISNYSYTYKNKLYCSYTCMNKDIEKSCLKEISNLTTNKKIDLYLTTEYIKELTDEEYEEMIDEDGNIKDYKKIKKFLHQKFNK